MRLKANIYCAPTVIHELSYAISVNPHNNTRYYLHFKGEETEIHKC